MPPPDRRHRKSPCSPVHNQDSQHTAKLHIRRRGRLSRAQARALRELGPHYMLPADMPLDVQAHFGRKAPLMLEIGFGTGVALLAFAESHPEMNCIGVEVYQPGIGNALQMIHARSVSNLRLMECDVRSSLGSVFEPGSLIRIHVFFPDPWPKKRHHKRRLIQADFVSLLASRLCDDGELRLSTDDASYANAMLCICDAEPLLSNRAGAGRFARDSNARPTTRFERRGQALGHEIHDLAYCRVGT